MMKKQSSPHTALTSVTPSYSIEPIPGPSRLSLPWVSPPSKTKRKYVKLKPRKRRKVNEFVLNKAIQLADSSSDSE